MRTVPPVVFLVLVMALPAVFPSSSLDECAAMGAPKCVTVSSGQPGGPTFYLYDAAIVDCAPQMNSYCTGHPFPTGGRPPVGFVGILYQENGNIEGLQRFDIVSGGHLYAGDRAVLL